MFNQNNLKMRKLPCHYSLSLEIILNIILIHGFIFLQELQNIVKS